MTSSNEQIICLLSDYEFNYRLALTRIFPPFQINENITEKLLYRQYMYCFTDKKRVIQVV